jgi:hypothetical protein
MSWYPAVHRAFRVKIARYVIVSNVSHLREKGRGEGTEPRKHRTLLVSREKKKKTTSSLLNQHLITRARSRLWKRMSTYNPSTYGVTDWTPSLNLCHHLYHQTHRVSHVQVSCVPPLRGYRHTQIRTQIRVDLRLEAGCKKCLKVEKWWIPRVYPFRINPKSHVN